MTLAATPGGTAVCTAAQLWCVLVSAGCRVSPEALLPLVQV